MKKKKSIKTYVEVDNTFCVELKKRMDDPYFLEVAYYYIRRALIIENYNLGNYEVFPVNGRFFGYQFDLEFSMKYNSVLKSLGLLMSLRSMMIDNSNINKCYDDGFFFYDLDNNFLTWNSHQIIMECIKDDDFRLLYEMVVNYKEKSDFTDEQKEKFKTGNIRPEYRNQEKYLKLIASDPSYGGKSVIKNNEYLYAEFEEFDVPKEVEYIGDTAFAYCRNLKSLTFTTRVSFGYFPIIECKELRTIIVPTDLVDYYKQELPYYKDIITDRKIRKDTQEPIAIQDNSKGHVVVDNSEIEHVFVDFPSSAPSNGVILEKDKSNQIVKLSTDNSIDPKKLSMVFDKKATSYKYFWFLAVITLAKEEDSLKVAYKDIVIRMAALAWPLVFDMDIALSKIDMLPKYLDEIIKESSLNKTSSYRTVENYLKQHFTSKGIDKILEPLLKNVPYRFLSPWIPFTTNEDVKEKSNSIEYACPYALGNIGILFDEDWWDYIMEHYSEVCGFIRESFISYIQKFNDEEKILKLESSGFCHIEI